MLKDIFSSMRGETWRQKFGPHLFGLALGAKRSGIKNYSAAVCLFEREGERERETDRQKKERERSQKECAPSPLLYRSGPCTQQKVTTPQYTTWSEFQ